MELPEQAGRGDELTRDEKQSLLFACVSVSSENANIMVHCGGKQNTLVWLRFAEVYYIAIHC